MKILLLSAYDAPSHQHWHQFLKAKLSQHQWRVLTLPPRYFSWRIRGNSLTWAFDEALSNTESYDCLIATSMVDLSSLRGMTPSLCQIPTALYFHENQFAYPENKNSHPSLEPQMVSLYAAISADRLIFNSQYNQVTFLKGVQDLLAKFPDRVPQGVVASLRDKSRNIAVPLADDYFMPSKSPESNPRSAVMTIVWNHRWEFDKGPDLLAECIKNLPKDLSLRFHILGQSFRSRPAVFEDIYRLLESRAWLGEWGYITRKSGYQKVLASSDIVLSTALHDFQGLSVLEAVALGCVPVLPDRLVYPEWFPSQYCYASDGDEVNNLCRLIVEMYEIHSSEGLGKAPSVESFSWQVLGPQYNQFVSELNAC